MMTIPITRGVDLNRNFGFKWAEGVNIFDPRPASPLPCLDTYHGPNAFSEPETKAVRYVSLTGVGHCKKRH